MPRRPSSISAAAYIGSRKSSTPNDVVKSYSHMHRKEKWRQVIRKAAQRFKRIVLRVILFPLSPLFWWGPLVHLYINHRALRQAEREAAVGNPAINRDLLRRLKRCRDVFIFAGISADAIATFHVLTGSSVYDYAHNSIPDSATGNPIFGYALIDEWRRSKRHGETFYPESEFAVACGWLAHQLADWYAHYAAVDAHGMLLPDPCTPPDNRTVFSGYANSHRVLRADFPPEILSQYRLVDHALIEFFHDLLVACYTGDRRFDTLKVGFFRNYRRRGRLYNLLTATSERFRGKGTRIFEEETELLRDTLHTVTTGMTFLVYLSTLVNPALPEAIYRGISPHATGKPDYIAMAVEAVVRGLFCKRYEEIATLSQPSDTPWPLYFSPTKVRTVTRPGTLLFRLAYRFGKLLPSNLSHFFRHPEDFSIRFLRFFELRGRMAGHILATLAFNGIATLTQWEEGGALSSFLAALLTDPHPNFVSARGEFRRRLKPVVEFGGDPLLSETERLTLMLNSGEIVVRVIPAVAFGDPVSWQVKALDFASLRFYLDGYEVRAEPESYELRVVETHERILELHLALKKELPEGFHRLQVEITDASHIAARPFIRDFWIGPTIQILPELSGT